MDPNITSALKTKIHNFTPENSLTINTPILNYIPTWIHVGPLLRIRRVRRLRWGVLDEIWVTSWLGCRRWHSLGGSSRRRWVVSIWSVVITRILTPWRSTGPWAGRTSRAWGRRVGSRWGIASSWHSTSAARTWVPPIVLGLRLLTTACLPTLSTGARLSLLLTWHWRTLGVARDRPTSRTTNW